MNLTEAKRIVLNKFKLIILVGLFGAVCAAGFKYCFTPSVIVQGNFVYTRIIQIEDVIDYTNPNFEFNYIGLFKTNASYLKLIEATDGRIFDFRKINSAWERENMLEKVTWLRKRMWMQSFHDNVVEIVFTVPAANISDIAYLEKNTKAFLDSMVLNVNAVLCQVKPHAVIKTVNSSVILPRKIENDKKSITLRYAVYGFIAGVFLSVAVLLGIPLFKVAQE